MNSIGASTVSTHNRLLVVLISLLALPSAALADFKVQLPDAETGEFEIEHVGSYGASGNPNTDNE